MIELLTTITIIAILIGLLVPAFALIHKTALNVKQKAQFNHLTIGLEEFYDDYNYYPDSRPVPHLSTPALITTNAQILAEAIVGWDGYGFHPKSKWQPDGTDGSYALSAKVPPADMVYINDSRVNGATEADRQYSISQRTGPYLELESANVASLRSIYGDPTGTMDWGDGRINFATGKYGGSFSTVSDSYVISDVYNKVKSKTTGNKVGMPIMYYKANSMAMYHNADIALNNDITDDNTNIYNVHDGRFWFDLWGNYVPFKGFSGHPLRYPSNPMYDDNIKLFYNMTANPEFTPVRPYRSESFILHSAGPDGYYGTPDDLFNFSPEN